MEKKLLERIAQLDRLSESERRLAEVFERDIRQVAFMNLVGIAERAGVGTATVTRFIRKLGYPGFIAFMKALREDTAEMLDSPISQYIRATHWDENVPESAGILQAHIESVAHNLHQSLASVPPDMFEKAVDLLADTRRQVYVTGGGAAEPLAAYFTLLAQYFRDDVRLLEPNAGSVGHQLAGMRPRALLVCIAYHRCSRISMQMMELFRRCGGAVVLVTDRGSSPLIRLADVPLVVHSEGGAGMFSSRAAGLALLEALLAALMPRRQDAIPERLARMEEVFSTIDAFAYPEAESRRVRGGPEGDPQT
ncbi:MurR/RpiR family transcriptional regulator [Oleispirillum naphthae]|uniref:MurR/RpiR family transcriptional regulator n=1 Tax=Oleispirillum naphthae TaxID=2838853 RepID=UPI0030826A13